MPYAWLVLAMVFILTSCGEIKPNSAAVETVETQSETDTPATATEGNPAPPTTAATIFPHSKNWADPASHGVWVLQNDTATCLKCHSSETTTAKAVTDGTPPTCNSCHPLFPHAENWDKKENHGAYVSTNGKENCATQCHGTDLKGGLSKISCDSCHLLYPHTTTWDSPEEHGVKALGDLKSTCKTCHGADLQGGSNGVSCFGCHEKFPHETDWKNPLKHGNFVRESGQQNCTTTCHGTDLKGGLSGVSCSSCHALYPHLLGWKNYDGHGKYVLTTLANDKTSCKTCHGSDLKGGSSGVSCYSCHTNYPHETGWKEAVNHGPKAYGTLKNSCAAGNCHGTTFQGTPQAPACSRCHNDFPHTDSKWMTPDKTKNAAVRDDRFHGDRFIWDIQRGETTPCTKCHGTDYGRNIGVAGLNFQCTQCHTNGITHTGAWSSTGHGTYYSALYNSLSANANCKDCHGSAVNFTDSQTKIFLEGQSECYRCHWAYPHKAYDLSSWHEVWEPVVPNNCGGMTNSAHLTYLMSSPLFTDVYGQRPTYADDPNSIPAIQHSCSGAAGSCHFNGRRSYNTGSTSRLCGKYCHSATTPAIPSRPPCL